MSCAGGVQYMDNMYDCHVPEQCTQGARSHLYYFVFTIEVTPTTKGYLRVFGNIACSD